MKTDILKFNVNDIVRVKLTQVGLNIIRKKEDCYRHLKISGIKRKKDKEGYTKFQLWELMSLFGDHLYNGCDVPFNPEIKIEIKKE